MRSMGAIREVILEEAELEWRLVEEQVFARQIQVMKEPLASLLSLVFSSRVIGRGGNKACPMAGVSPGALKTVDKRAPAPRVLNEVSAPPAGPAEGVLPDLSCQPPAITHPWYRGGLRDNCHSALLPFPPLSQVRKASRALFKELDICASILGGTGTGRDLTHCPA